MQDTWTPAAQLMVDGRLEPNVFLQIFNVPNRVNVLAVRTSLFNAGAPTRVDNGRQFQFGFDLKF